jgi:hypothetical protein
MIQRIQSVLFLVAAVCFALACFMQVGTITTHDTYYVVTSWALKVNIPDGAIVYPTYFIGLMQIILAFISFVAIFLYKNRPMQSKFCIAAIFVNFVLLILLMWVYPEIVFSKLPQVAGAEIHYYEKGQCPWMLLSIIPLACLYLANKFIIKDEKKVRAADRLR